MKPTSIPVVAKPGQPRTMRVSSGSVEFVATERAPGAWECEQTTPGPFVCGVSQAAAQAVLAELVRTRAEARQSPKPRGVCLSCGAWAALDEDGLFVKHGWRGAAKGNRAVCRGSGQPQDPDSAPVGPANDIPKSPEGT